MNLYNEASQMKDIESALKNKQIEPFRHLFLELHPYNQAQFFEKQKYDQRLQVYYYLSPEEVAVILEHIDADDTDPYFSEMEVTFAADVFAKMAVDDAVDILNEFDKDKVASFLTIMDEEAANEIKHLLHYEEKTAGSIMTTEYVAFFQKQKVHEAMQELKGVAPSAEMIYYLYVVDENKKLTGVLSLRSEERRVGKECRARWARYN